jgi:hypothetical protein
MVAPDYHEEDGDYHSSSSSTQIPSQHPLRDCYRERCSGGVDLSTVPLTPLSNCHHLLSPVRTERLSHSYNLHTTPDRIAALDREGSQGDSFGRAVAGGGVAESAVVVGSVAGTGGGRVAGRGVVGGAGGDRRHGGAGMAAARVVGGVAGRPAARGTVGRGVGAWLGRAVVGSGGRVTGGGGRT